MQEVFDELCNQQTLLGENILPQDVCYDLESGNESLDMSFAEHNLAQHALFGMEFQDSLL